MFRETVFGKECCRMTVMFIYHDLSIATSFMQRPVHLSLGRVKTNMDGQKYGWTGDGRGKK